MRKKILVVFGTRPEAIKMIPVANAIKEHHAEVKICVTAQHRQMLDQVLTFFSVVPDYDLNLMRENQSLSQLTGNIINGISEVLKSFKPDVVLVHGDTTTSMASALAAFYNGVQIGHVEAGLRTYDKLSPFPEEINRQIIGRLADFHFAPTQSAKENLIGEGVALEKIPVTGNTVIDAMNNGLTLLENYNDDEIDLVRSKIDATRPIILITGHRRENFGLGFTNICEALKRIALARPDVQLVYPVHLNPNVQEPVHNLLKGVDNIFLIKPLGYPAFLWLMRKCMLIITDSGGIQEEAPSLKKPVLVMRDVTERMEAIESGSAKLVGTNQDLIFSETIKLLSDSTYFDSFTNKPNPYGDGKASSRIADFLLNGEI
jgi:UDP-N-acetylglucosamine 2-epimerase (non-hydrolysing)